MRLAMICPYLPAPPISGGRIRIHRLASELAGQHEVVLFAKTPPRQLKNPDAQASLAIYSKAYTARQDLLRFQPPVLPNRVVRSKKLLRALRTEHARAPFDLAIVEHSHAASLVLDTGLPFLIDEHNIESDYVREHHAASTHGELGSRQRRQLTLLQGWERKVWQHANAVVCVSDSDAETVRRLVRSTPVTVVPNGSSVSEINFRLPSQRAAGSVLFVGMMSHPPNVAAARLLFEEVMPRVWPLHPETRLVLCGHEPSSEVKAFAGRRVEVTGSVASVQPYLDEAAIVVNPLLHGAGTSLKVVEALASGAPLVTTRLGVRGYGEDIAAACLIADSPQEMANAIRSCLEGPDDDARAKLGRQAALEYDWIKLAADFGEVVQQAARKA